MGGCTQATLFLFLLATITLFDTGDCDKCHRQYGVCKLSVGATCMGVSRSNECRYSHYRCCYPPMRGKRRRRRSAENIKKDLQQNMFLRKLGQSSFN